jgi:Fe-S-cluster formation regulator IscX/YfhJ
MNDEKNKVDPNSVTYLKFLHLSEALRTLDKFPALDAIEERLLNQCALSWLDGKAVTVVEAMKSSEEISPSTAHRRLKNLRKKGYITLVLDDLDNRVKYITYSQQTREYFSQLGACLTKSTTA